MILALALIVLLTAALADYWLVLPAGVRFAGTGPLALLLAVGLLGLLRLIRRPAPVKEVALDAESQQPGLGCTVSTAAEYLTGERNIVHEYEPQLVDALHAQAAVALENAPLPYWKNLRAPAALLAGALVLLLGFIALASGALIALQRVVVPFSDAANTRIEVKPGTTELPVGRDVEIEAVFLDGRMPGDPAIHYQLYAGNGLVFNAGERVEGYSNFLWIVLVSLFKMTGFSLINSARILGILSALGTAIVGAYTVRRLVFEDAQSPWLFCLWYLLSIPVIYWSQGGLETALISFLIICFIYCQTRTTKAWFWAGVWVVLGALTRPEAHMFAILYCIVLIFGYQKKERVMGISFVGGFLLLYHLARIMYFGELLPTTALIKTSGAFTLGLPLSIFLRFRRRGKLVLFRKAFYLHGFASLSQRKPYLKFPLYQRKTFNGRFASVISVPFWCVW